MAMLGKTSLALAAAALCAATARAAVPTPAPADPTFPCKGGLTLGMLAPTSGTAAAIGIDQVRWAQLFVARWNATHSITLRLQVLDTGLDAARAAATAQGLAADPTVLGVIGPAGSDEVVSAAPELQKARLSFVSASAWSESLTTTAGLLGYFFRVVPHGGVQPATVVRFMTGKLGVAKGASAIVVDDQVAADATLAAAVQQGLAGRGDAVRTAGIPCGPGLRERDRAGLPRRARQPQRGAKAAPEGSAADDDPRQPARLHPRRGRGGRRLPRLPGRERQVRDDLLG